MKRKILVAIGVLLLLAGLAVLLYPTAKTAVLRGKERDSIEAFIQYLGLTEKQLSGPRF